MLMMLAGLGFSGNAPADAHDAARLGFLWQRAPQLMLLMLAGLGVLWQRTPQLMLMMLAG